MKSKAMAALPPPSDMALLAAAAARGGRKKRCVRADLVMLNTPHVYPIAVLTQQQGACSHGSSSSYIFHISTYYTQAHYLPQARRRARACAQDQY